MDCAAQEDQSGVDPEGTVSMLVINIQVVGDFYVFEEPSRPKQNILFNTVIDHLVTHSEVLLVVSNRTARTTRTADFLFLLLLLLVL